MREDIQKSVLTIPERFGEKPIFSEDAKYDGLSIPTFSRQRFYLG
jgi:hypothetical protein